jgi:hypothetical protein
MARPYLALLNGKRGLYGDITINTQFCMSNPEARHKVAEYVAEYSARHTNVDYLHVWLGDAIRNHCECEECAKKTVSDQYVMLLNDIDRTLSEKGLSTRIVFIMYTDTTWAPLEERIEHPARFTMMLAPIARSYTQSMSENRPATVPFVRNQCHQPKTLDAFMSYYEEWRKVWQGAGLAFEYHFWRHLMYDLTGLEMSRRVYDDVHIYKENGIDGVIEDASVRPFFPNGLVFYTYARSLYDGSLTYDAILEDYYSHAYGEDWKKFYDYLKRIGEALPYDFFSRDCARLRKNVHFDPAQAEKIASIREITKEGRALIEEHLNYPKRAQTVAVRLLLRHAELCDMVSDWMAAKARGELEKATELFNHARITFGKSYRDIHTYFDHYAFFAEALQADKAKSPGKTEVFDI